jgi:hypothetical protein
VLVLYQIFYACAGHCERGIVHKIAWRATRSCMPHPLAQCIQTLIGDTLELFMTQCGFEVRLQRRRNLLCWQEQSV